ncbi:unnamed protein product, partial [marine sediment metagenome]
GEPCFVEYIDCTLLYIRRLSNRCQAVIIAGDRK